MRVLGVDGGVSGAFALIDDRGRLVELCDTPTTKEIIDGHERRRLDLDELLVLLRFWGIDEAMFEKGQEIPRVGDDGRRRAQSGMYQYGMTNGMVVGATHALGIPWSIVEPQTWKRKLHLLGKDKEASRTLATEIFGSDRFWKAKSHHNRAEAALIAHYCRLVRGADA